MDKKRALITGITGMDGSHLADFLLSKGYIVFGMERRSSQKNRENTKLLEGNSNFTFLNGDLSDQNSILRVLKISKPNEVYNLGAQSFVSESWNTPEQTANITGLGALRVLEAIREYGEDIKYYQASTSEMFGNMKGVANEHTIFNPRSPYGVAKLYGHWITKNYRESYNMFNVSGILFNHESERRGIEFVTRKITDGVARIKHGLQDNIILGNLETSRDWGYAPDYVESMWMMLQQDKPNDYVIATGQTHELRDFLSIAFEKIGISNWEKYILQDKKFMRPADVYYLKGDATKAKHNLDWKPKTSFEEMISIMVDNDIRKLNK
jgi:GDPmannose 4,6-dehydratase